MLILKIFQTVKEEKSVEFTASLVQIDKKVTVTWYK